jgi:hypothetical protein
MLASKPKPFEGSVGFANLTCPPNPLCPPNPPKAGKAGSAGNAGPYRMLARKPKPSSAGKYLWASIDTK